MSLLYSKARSYVLDGLRLGEIVLFAQWLHNRDILRR